MADVDPDAVQAADSGCVRVSSARDLAHVGDGGSGVIFAPDILRAVLADIAGDGRPPRDIEQPKTDG
ncbi:MAG: hypothetical protein ACJ762_06510 [Solirubrobacteraceae bacterium]